MISLDIDVVDKKILNSLQAGISLVERPFLELADKLSITEQEAIDRIARLKGDQIRQISAIFDTRTLGYKSSLVAVRVPEERLDQVASIINQHPGVTHNYKRNHEYNLWFTIAVPPNSKLGLEGTVQKLGELAKVPKEAVRLMPTLKLYKIGVQLDMTGKEDGASQKQKPAYSESDRASADKNLSDFDIAVILQLQKDLPLTQRPFDCWAEELEVPTEKLLECGKLMQTKKQMRRFAAVLNHRKAGFLFNGMGVWVVPPEEFDAVGAKMSHFKAVSHCYLRPTYSDWPYSIFTMVHGRTLQECEDILAAISRETCIEDYITLYSTKEYKKTRVVYFTPEIIDWELSVTEKFASI